MSTELRALPLLVCALTCGSTCVWASPDQLPDHRLLAVRFDTSDMVRPASEIRVARPSTCYEIRVGDTAARLAQRFTGNEFNRYQMWFQIVDPATGAFLPKARYNLIQSGWHVCVATDMLRLRSMPAGYSSVSPASPVLPRTVLAQNAVVIDPRMAWWATPLFVLISGLLLAWSWKHLDDRRARLEVMKRFGNRFISEFEGPLSRSVKNRPIKSRLRCAPSRRKVEILIAPANGHTYPNLVDHRRNVEYDTARVLRLLRQEPFIGGPPYAEGRWVVIPCRLETGR